MWRRRILIPPVPLSAEARRLAKEDAVPNLPVPGGGDRRAEVFGALENPGKRYESFLSVKKPRKVLRDFFKP